MDFVFEKLGNKNGMEVILLNFGATLMNISVPGKAGGRADLILGYDNAEGYLEDRQFLGSTPGRYANRIAKAQFSLNGKEYNLTPNEGRNHLHGGSPSFAHSYWNTTRETNLVTFTYVSPDGENGYPGNMTATVVYSLNDENEIVMDYTAISDADTVVNLTNHAYFNLSGGGQPAMDHMLQVNADSFVVTDEEYNPTGEIRSVIDTSMDLNSPRRLGDVVNSDYEAIKQCKGLDSCFVVNGSGLRRAAVLSDPGSGRALEVDTDMPGVQVYTAQMLPEGTEGRGGLVYGPYSGVCLEAQNYPDAPNHPHFPSAVLKAGETYKAKIIYRFKF